MPDPKDFGVVNYTVLGVYLAAMVAIGLWMARRQKRTEDYFVAGRNMPWWVVSLSIFASLASAISYLGLPALAYEENVSLIAGYVVAPIGALLLIWLFYPFYQKLGVTTSYEYLGRRYGRGGRIMVSILFLLARLGWLGNVFLAPSIALNIVTGIPLWLAIVLMGVLATMYTVLGGLAAVLWTDVVQFIILVGGGIWISITLIQNVPGGFDGIWNFAYEQGRLDGFGMKISLVEMSASAAMIVWIFNAQQEYGTDQVTVQRIMAVRSFWGKAKAVLLNSFFDIAIVGMLLFMGIGFFAYAHHHPDWLTPHVAEKADRLGPHYILTVMPVGIAGLMISAVFAAAMSSMDSGIHSMSTVITHDIIRPLRRRPVSDFVDLMVARGLVVALGVLATAAAFLFASAKGFKHIIDISYMVLGTFNGPILGIFLLGVLTKRVRFYSCLHGVAAGFVLAILLKNETQLHSVWYFSASFGMTFLCGYLVSLPRTIGPPLIAAVFFGVIFLLSQDVWQDGGWDLERKWAAILAVAAGISVFLRGGLAGVLAGGVAAYCLHQFLLSEYPWATAASIFGGVIAAAVIGILVAMSYDDRETDATMTIWARGSLSVEQDV